METLRTPAPVKGPQPLQIRSPCSPPHPQPWEPKKTTSESPRDPGVRALNQPAPTGESEPPQLWIPDPSQKAGFPDPASERPAPSLQGPRSPSFPPPPEAPGTGRWRPGPPPSGSRCPPSSSLSLKHRVLEAALASPWQQESILCWEHTAPAAAPPPTPRPSNPGLRESGGPEGRLEVRGEGGKHRNTQRDRDL